MFCYGFKRTVDEIITLWLSNTNYNPYRVLTSKAYSPDYEMLRNNLKGVVLYHHVFFPKRKKITEKPRNMKQRFLIKLTDPLNKFLFIIITENWVMVLESICVAICISVKNPIHFGNVKNCLK